MADALVCPGCGVAPGSGAEAERFCAECGLPLVHADRSGLERPVTAAHERARKVRPQYTEGALVTVAGARNQAEAELIQGLLLEEGVPSMLRRTRGFDVPDMLAAGPRDVLVPRSGAEAAREVLLQAELLEEPSGARADGIDRPSRVLAVLLATVALVAVVAWIGTELLV
jgi:pimeloyl-ACP methyl ester carboxylesterase